MPVFILNWLILKIISDQDNKQFRPVQCNSTKTGINLLSATWNKQNLTYKINLG